MNHREDVRWTAALRRGLLSALVVALWSGPAAAESSGDVRAQAREHARQARIHYDLGRFEEALAEYEAAYELLPAPGVLFNLGQCHRQLGHHERAIFFFEGYLRGNPDAANYSDVEELIVRSRAELERQAAEEAAAQEAEEPPEAPPEPVVEPPPEDPIVEPPPEEPIVEPPRPFYRTWWFWTIIGAAVVGTGVGLGLGLQPDDPVTVLPSGSLGTLDGRR